MDLKEAVRESALRLGFSHAGFSRAQRLPGAPLLDWLRNGSHGTMEYMERDPEVRLDPRKLLPGCKTVISLALNYYTPYPTKSHPDHGRISRYAWGRDYHKVIREKLKKLAETIFEIAPESKIKPCVDSTPILEKTWAERAGIGWRGKNTNLITKDLGSWIFLAELLTDLEIEPDFPHADFCGSCGRCVESCPTQALKPYVLDANLCISYLTIETKNRIPDEIAGKMGDWIFGCDICQEVCPWNKFAATTEEEAFFPKLENQKSLEAFANLSEVEFHENFAGTPLFRPGRSHLAESARIARNNLQKEKEEKCQKSLSSP